MSKISELPVAGTLTGAETIPVVQTGSTKKITLNDAIAVHTVAADPHPQYETAAESDARIAAAIAGVAVGGLIDVQVFTASGTWTKPAGTTKIEVWCVGGGGGGGSANTTAAGEINVAPAGGAGGGAYLFANSGIGATVAVTVGAGGTGGTGGAAGTSGGTSSFGSLCVATGGGSQTNTSGAPPRTPVNSSVGDGTTGTILIAGSFPQMIINSSTTLIMNQTPGLPPFGVGRATFATTTSTFTTGTTATGGYGTGGTGGMNCPSQGTARAGGNGTGGIVIVKSYR